MVQEPVPGRAVAKKDYMVKTAHYERHCQDQRQAPEPGTKAPQWFMEWHPDVRSVAVAHQHFPGLDRFEQWQRQSRAPDVPVFEHYRVALKIPDKFLVLPSLTFYADAKITVAGDFELLDPWVGGWGIRLPLGVILGRDSYAMPARSQTVGQDRCGFGHPVGVGL